ncbi:MAG: alkaline phosphatase family protein, partial [Solirubrobacteraceae bacterium]
MAKPGSIRGRLSALAAVVAGVLIMAAAAGSAAGSAPRHRTAHDVTLWPSPSHLATATPIKHLVVIFQENVSFDKYFATYPYALNPPGEPRFVPAPGTPSVNGLGPALLVHNPNLADPVRLAPDTGNACGSNHNYLNEQEAFDNGLVDRFVEFTGSTDPGCPQTRTLGCGYGPRLPLLIISPWARVNHVDNTLTDQTSIIHFVEDNWLDGERIGDGSYDEISGPLTGMFNFAGRSARAPDLFLDPNTGE